MPRLRLFDAELHYEDTREGEQTVLFSHGLLCSTRLFDPQRDAMRQHFRCVAYDHRGQGQSSTPPAPLIDMETLYTDAVELIEQLRIGPVHFVGLSMGGFVGMRLAARRPDLVRSLTLISSAPDPEPRANLPKYNLLNTIARTAGANLVADRILPIMVGDTTLQARERKEVRDTWRQHFANLPRSIYKAVNGVLYRPSIERELPKISCPTLILWGTEDHAIARSRAERCAELIPNSEMIVIPQAGHSATVENPEPINRALLEFLS